MIWVCAASSLHLWLNYCFVEQDSILFYLDWYTDFTDEHG